MKIDFDDILIAPARISKIRSRKDVHPTKDAALPLFVAPMDTVIDEKNLDLFLKRGVNVAIPRTMFKGKVENYHERAFTSMSLSEFKSIYLGFDIDNKISQLNNQKFQDKVLIDIANGHMSELISAIRDAKRAYGRNLIIMAGNVANPNSYYEYAEAGVDYIRAGIGNGGGCLTTANVGVGYPMASLIKEIYQIKLNLGYGPKIVADGGFKKYSDVIKALALGADFVMLGSIFNKCLESAGDTYEPSTLNKLGNKIDQYDTNWREYLKDGGTLYKKFRGMSTKEAQAAMGNKVLKTSEGVNRIHKVEYTLDQWLENFEDYLRSAMSYTDCVNLDEFIGGPEIIQISENSFKRFNK